MSTSISLAKGRAPSLRPFVSCAHFKARSLGLLLPIRAVQLLGWCLSHGSSAPVATTITVSSPSSSTGPSCRAGRTASSTSVIGTASGAGAEGATAEPFVHLALGAVRIVSRSASLSACALFRSSSIRFHLSFSSFIVSGAAQALPHSLLLQGGCGAAPGPPSFAASTSPLLRLFVAKPMGAAMVQSRYALRLFVPSLPFMTAPRLPFLRSSGCSPCS